MKGVPPCAAHETIDAVASSTGRRGGIPGGDKAPTALIRLVN
jgi:hypothetical protein